MIKKIVHILIVILLAVEVSAQNREFEREIQTHVSDYNAMLPMEVSEGLTMRKVRVEGKTLVYEYDMSEEMMKLLKNTGRESRHGIGAEIIASDDMRDFFGRMAENGYSFKIDCVSGKQRSAILFTPKEIKELTSGKANSREGSEEKLTTLIGQVQRVLPANLGGGVTIVSVQKGKKDVVCVSQIGTEFTEEVDLFTYTKMLGTDVLKPIVGSCISSLPLMGDISKRVFETGRKLRFVLVEKGTGRKIEMLMTAEDLETVAKDVPSEAESSLRQAVAAISELTPTEWASDCRTIGAEMDKEYVTIRVQIRSGDTFSRETVDEWFADGGKTLDETYKHNARETEEIANVVRNCGKTGRKLRYIIERFGSVSQAHTVVIGVGDL
ncbi:MAG: hypothetical protein II951_00675 [Bacteroidales bacterium]|nr:hypothetical protein [Bacteroidales bacterium]